MINSQGKESTYIRNECLVGAEYSIAPFVGTTIFTDHHGAAGSPDISIWEIDISKYGAVASVIAFQLPHMAVRKQPEIVI